jgi:phosphoribosylaminoimidazole-succinocarboxamide synthase
VGAGSFTQGAPAGVNARPAEFALVRFARILTIILAVVRGPGARLAVLTSAYGRITPRGDAPPGPYRWARRTTNPFMIDTGSGPHDVLAPVELLHSGKVRDVYADGAELILVASDRISVYDVVLPTPIPDKGKLLTALSLWWFEQLADLVPNHVISTTDVPAEFAGRAIRCRRLEMAPVECIARGYLTGLGLKEYERTGAVSGVTLPPGLVESSILSVPIFTPTTKAPVGEHDEFITFDDLAAKVGAETAERLRDITLTVYRRGAELAADRGIIVADTKIELGWAPDGTLVLADEVLTSDSSRFWPAESYQPGRVQFSYDKQYVRDWASGSGWDRRAPAPEVPGDVVEATRARYVEVYERLTGRTW